MIFDDTSEATLTLWNEVVPSAAKWKPSETVLLLTSPGYDPTRKGRLSVTFGTFVEVNPAMYDAEWLRERAKKRSKRDHVNLPFPENGDDKLVDSRTPVLILR